MANNSFGAAAKLRVGGAEYDYFSLATLARNGVGNVGRLPISIRILLENLLRNEDGKRVNPEDVAAVASGSRRGRQRDQLHAGARAAAGLHRRARAWWTWPPCAMRWPRWAATRSSANPLMPADLVIDHSVQVDEFGTPDAFDINALLEFQRNRERYAFLRWGQTAFQNFRVVPPDTGIVHQVNLEYLAPVVFAMQPTGPMALSRYAGGHGFAHHDDQRTGRGGLGRGRNRGRGLHAGPAHLHAAAAGGRLQAARQAAGRRAPPPTWC